MSYALSTLRTKLRNKINQRASASGQVWLDPELDGYINDGIKQILSQGPGYLIENGMARTPTGSPIPNGGSGYATKPEGLLRFMSAQVDGVWIRRVLKFHEIEFVQGNQNTVANSERKYVVEVSGTEFLVLPDTFTGCHLIYVTESPDLALDTDTSPLHNSGDAYAIDWAFALALESKNFKPEVAKGIFARVNAMIERDERPV